MRKVGPRVAAASATVLALLGLSVGTVQGDGIVETIYAAPTTYYVPSTYVTTSRVVPTTTSYVVPTTTSYVLPASYTTTAYSYLPSYSVVPTTYYTTSYYRRPGLFRRWAARPVYETAQTYAVDLTPTTFYQPTTIAYDSPLVASGYTCVEAAVPFTPPAPVNGNGNGNGDGEASPASKSINSTPKNGEVEPPYTEPPAEKPKAAPKEPAKDSLSPPPGPAPEKTDKEAPGGGLSEPPQIDAPKDPGDLNRSSFRPRATEMKPREGAAAPNMLRGEVVSGSTDAPVPNVQVVFADQTKTFPDRTKTTDAKGAFEVYLPNGGWTIRVVDPSAAAGAKPKEYGQITSTGGSYLDDSDRPVYRLKLSQ